MYLPHSWKMLTTMPTVSRRKVTDAWCVNVIDIHVSDQLRCFFDKIAASSAGE